MQGDYLFVFRVAESNRPASCGDERFLRLASSLEPQKKVYAYYPLSELHALREKAVREEIATRLRYVCGNFSPDDFDQLVQKMAELQLKDERRLVW